jgi:hypothetical protein
VTSPKTPTRRTCEGAKVVRSMDNFPVPIFVLITGA